MVAAARSAWREVPRHQVRRFAARALEEVPSLAQEILREIRREFPQLPLVADENGEPRALTGIRQSLEHFVDHMTAGLDRPLVHPRVFQDFGRGEGIHGRSLDALQAIYRLGVRLAWRRLAEIGQQVSIPAPAMYELAESGFEYLDGLVAESVRGFAEAAARQAGERLRLQRRLMELLFTEHGRTGGGAGGARNGARAGPRGASWCAGTAAGAGTGYGSGQGDGHGTGDGDRGGRRAAGGARPGSGATAGSGTGRSGLSAGLVERAARIGWPLPERVAVAVLLRPARESVAPAVPADVLLDMDCERPRMVVPEPDAAGRRDLLRRATAGWSGAIGPAVPLMDAAKSLRWATAAVDLMERGLLPSGRMLHCTEHTEALILLPPEELIEDLTRRRLAPLAHCGPTHGRRLAETLLAWLETRGGAPEVAARLGVHPQTVRYRLRQIRELWGADMEDPDRRFELELVLRARRLRGALGVPGRE
ncbi:helix-turn-helix domain-containing protein [Streptomyces sp. MST-110588]|uniref:PucR family transcriptional regulator n=1 Tax=Streptomyces sp. MST-110588 TaxID=2833628 RepID=UPI001F5DD77B|nr:helix-turn-helix domain-containing protein [Streptomyces sp. MST-110588]UNO42231.1 helix-turn-helix domain-containing protein [Streptomyces sp. MST-110588]